VAAKNFDGDGAAEACIARPIHLAHAARADSGQHLVRAETLTGTERHLNLLRNAP
jgi:hypothetical protein